MRSGDQESILCGHARQSGADPDFLSKSQVDSDFDVLRNMRLADLLLLGRQSAVRQFTSGRRNAARAVAAEAAGILQVGDALGV
jgi:hypothetical protein